MSTAELMPEETTTTLAEYDFVSAALADLRRRYEGATYDLATTAGMKDAVAARAELRNLRTSLEAKRKEIKAPALDRCRLIDGEAKRITAELVALEDPIDAQIKAEQARRKAEKEAKEKAERERLAQIERDRLAAEKAEQERLAQIERDRIAAEQAELDRRRAEQERLAAEKEAELAAERAKLEAEKAEAEREALEAAEAAQAKLDAELAEKERIAREAREKADAEAAAKREAERKKLEEEQAAVRAEQERLDKERAAAEAKAEEERKAREQAELEAQAERHRLAAEEQAKKEALEIEHATLLGAANEVVACFADWGVEDELPARKLAAAVAREGKAAAE